MNGDYGKIEAFKENWYALAACMCSQKIKSRAQAFSLMGIPVTKEPNVAIRKKMVFDKSEVESLYKKIGSIRGVAKHLGCNESTLFKFFKKEKIQIIEVRPLISDKYDKKAIERLHKEGKNSKEIAEIMGYTKHTLYKYIKANLA